MRRLLTGLIVVAGLVLPEIASATVYRGETSRGRKASVVQNADGRVQRVSIHWRGSCQQVGAHITTSTRFVEPLEHQSSTSIREDGFYLARYRGGVRVRYVVAMTGKRTDPYRWRGTFSARATVRENGRVVDRCRLGRVSWQASIPKAAIHMESDSGDYILGGGTVDVRTPEDNVPVSASKRFVSAQAGPYTIEIQAPNGKSLKPGTTFKTTRYPFNGGGGGLSVSGDGRGCNEATGTVTVRAGSFDRDGTARRIVIEFEHHCEGGEAALRGTLRFRR